MFEFNDELMFLKKLVVGIGEVEKITHVPQRQLRYWESKGIIKTTENDEKGATRCFSYLEIKKIILIKELLDEGYTLEAADKKIMKRMATVQDAFEQLKKSHKNRSVL